MPEPRWTWAVLLVLLALLFVGSLTIDRSSWPSLVGDEATYLMQAESLAWGPDLLYGPGDFERFVAHRGRKPEGLILQSGDGGRTITYGKPFFYALYLAPFVRLAPENGPFAANALALALASLLAARTLRRRIGPNAPLWIALLVFGSVTFAYTFWAHPDLFLLCLVAIAFALALEEGGRGSRTAARWVLVGLLIATAAYSRPMYAVLLLPATLAAVPAWRRHVPALAAGALLVAAGAATVHQSLTGSWTGYGATRRGFYSYTGFPAVDFPASEWQENLEDWGDHRWLKPSELGRKKLRASLWGWNALYFTAGRHVGLLPYFLPVVLALACRPRGAVAWGLLASFVLGAAAFLWLRPFNFWGGGGALANRYVLPLLPALWFLPRRPIRRRWMAAAGLLAALFVGPLWLAPFAFPLMEEGSYGYVSPVAKRLLPYETTQSHLKPSGQEDVFHQGLWIKFLDRGVGALRGGELLRLRGGGGTILVGSAEPLTVLELEIRLPSGTEIEIEGGETEGLAPHGPWRRIRLSLDPPRARHPMWWTWDPFHLYTVTLTPRPEAENPIPLRLHVGDADRDESRKENRQRRQRVARRNPGDPRADRPESEPVSKHPFRHVPGLGR